PKVEQTAQIDRTAVGSSRLLGQEPGTGRPVVVRLGKYGPLAQIGESGNDDNPPKFASLRHGQRIENITLEEALELFKLPRDLGYFEDQTLTVNTGRFGPYVKHQNKFYSLDKEDDPLTIDTARAIELIRGKRQADAERLIKQFSENPDIQILNGRWGPYIKAGKKNVKIPKEVEDPSKLTLAQCMTFAEQAPVKPAKKARGKRK
ncbi:MAG: topoisomerase C-terminal repeat-containing protein, partial [Bacteroidota bacterium]